MLALLRGRGVRLLMALVVACLGVASASHYTGTYADETGNTLVVSQDSAGALTGQLTVNGVVYQVSGSAPGDVPGQGMFTSQQGSYSFTVQLSPDGRTISFEVREVNAQGQPTGAQPFTVQFTRRSNDGFNAGAPTPGFPTTPSTVPPANMPPTNVPPATTPTVPPLAPPAQMPPATTPSSPLFPTNPAEVVRGNLGAGSQVLQSGEFVDPHERTFTAGVPIQLVLRSAQFDAYLLVLGPDFNVVLEVDNSANMGTNVSETVVPNVNGTYTILVTTSRPGEAGAYELEINPVAAAPTPTPGQTPGAFPTPPTSSPLAPPVSSPTTPGAGLDPALLARAQDPSQGSVGVIPANTVVNGRLAGASGSTYHTYLFEVPAGAQQVTFVMNSDSDLDLFVKLGSEIQDWNEGGDWTQRDITPNNNARLVINAPQAGPWFIDLVFYQGGNATANYTFEVVVR